MKGSELKELRKEKGWTQEYLAEMLSVSKRTVINYEQSDQIPKSKVKLLHVLFNEKSALNSIGVNEPTEVYSTKAGSTYEELGNGRYLMTVPLIPVRAQARYLSEFTDAEFLSELKPVTFVVDRVGKGKYLAFEIQNDSMDDDSKRSIPDGAIVLGRQLGKHHWKNPFRTAEFPNWIIVHKDGILCKEIIKHDVGNGVITCHSLNKSPEYSDFDLHLDDVQQLFNIVKKQL